jgi:hypothetical protein
MALDTRSRRASAIGIAAVFLLAPPLADGVVGQPDRQHVAYCYPGVTSSAVSVLNLSTATTRALMSERTTSGLAAERSSRSLMPTRTTEAL